MRNLIAIVFAVIAGLTNAQDWEDRASFISGNGTRALSILSSTDVVYLAPILKSFADTQDDLKVDYFVTGTADIYDIIRKSPRDFDLVISSAMDLQIKLVNDGAALPLGDIDVPQWTHWRQSLFGFTAEPAAIVVNKAAF